MRDAEAVFILVGADILFNKGQLTSRVVSCFYDILKEYYRAKNEKYIYISQEDLTNACFGC